MTTVGEALRHRVGGPVREPSLAQRQLNHQPTVARTTTTTTAPFYGTVDGTVGSNRSHLVRDGLHVLLEPRSEKADRDGEHADAEDPESTGDDLKPHTTRKQINSGHFL